MQAEHNDALILPELPEPFALIAGTALDALLPADLETALRHMGLRPEPVENEAGDGRLAPPLFRLRLGAETIVVARAADDALDLADPRHPSTSLLAASLRPDWRNNGPCWLFVREAGEAPEMQPDRLRAFFKTMVLLIDLFDASHIFWSPARLWSDAPQFRGAVAEMLASGMPPVLHLVAFRRRETREETMVCTRGLALFGGQELEGRIPDGWTVAEMVQRLARLALDIILNGPIPTHRRLRGLEPGEWISLSPGPQTGDRSATVLVEFGSDL